MFGAPCSLLKGWDQADGAGIKAHRKSVNSCSAFLGDWRTWEVRGADYLVDRRHDPCSRLPLGIKTTSSVSKWSAAGSARRRAQCWPSVSWTSSVAGTRRSSLQGCLLKVQCLVQAPCAVNQYHAAVNKQSLMVPCFKHSLKLQQDLECFSSSQRCQLQGLLWAFHEPL